MDRVQRQPSLRGRPGDRPPHLRALRGAGGRPGGRHLQPLRVGADAARRDAGGAADPGEPARRRRGGRARPGAPRRLHLRAGARADPRAPAPGLRRDGALPGAARVGRLRAGRAHDRDAQRVEERRRADRRPHAPDEPGPPGRDHAGDPGGGRRRRRADRPNKLPTTGTTSESVQMRRRTPAPTMLSDSRCRPERNPQTSSAHRPA